MGKKIFVLGAGGHASVLVDILKQNGMTIAALFSPEVDFVRGAFTTIPIHQSENEIFEICSENIDIINGLGSLPRSTSRAKLYDKFNDKGYSFIQVISKHAIISDFATLGKGVQVMPGVIIQAGAVIGANTIVNSGAIIEHDCVIGAHNHIAPGVTLSGQVQTGDNVHIGTGANVIQNIKIGDKAVIGAGANVIQDVLSEETVFGVKAEVKNTRLDK